jgi:hypothetical protein
MDFIDAHRMTGAPHPPDPTPSDFFLFGDAKRELSGCSFGRADDLLTAVQEPLDGFEKSTSISVFDEWVKRLEQCIETQRWYVGCAKQWIRIHSAWFGEGGDANGCAGHLI